MELERDGKSDLDQTLSAAQFVDPSEVLGRLRPLLKKFNRAEQRWAKNPMRAEPPNSNKLPIAELKNGMFAHVHGYAARNGSPELFKIFHYYTIEQVSYFYAANSAALMKWKKYRPLVTMLCLLSVALGTYIIAGSARDRNHLTAGFGIIWGLAWVAGGIGVLLNDRRAPQGYSLPPTITRGPSPTDTTEYTTAQQPHGYAGEERGI